MVLHEKLNQSMPSSKTLIYLVLPLLFLIIVFPAALQPGHALISDYHDTICLVLPDVFLMQNPFALWNNQWLTGISDIASMNTDRFYPLSFPFFLVSQDIFIVTLILLLHLYIAYLAFFKLGSLLVKSPDLLFLFSTLYMFSGVLISRISIGHIFFVYAMAWIPLVFYFFLKITYGSEPTVKNIIALVLCEAMLVFCSASYYLFFANIILAIFFFYYLLTHQLSRAQLIALFASLGLFSLISAIKLIPNLTGLAFIERIDIINPLADGGSLENNLSSFLFGTPIDTVFGPYETMALIGVIPVLFVIIALVWGDRKITVPSFFALVFSLIWADGGRILVSFIHLLPLVSSFRNAGRIFGAIMPIVLLLSIYGVYLLQQRISSGELLATTREQKRSILFGVGILALIKILELPFMAVPSLEAALAVILVLGFILLLYLDKVTVSTLLCYFSLSLLVSATIILKNFSVLTDPVLLNTLVIGSIILCAILLLNRNIIDRMWVKKQVFVCLLLVGILLSIAGNISVLKAPDPAFEKSPALQVIEKIQETPGANPQIWVYETGWPIQHMDFTYWFVKSGIHPMRAFYSYVPLYTPPLALQFNGTDYYTADYLVDTAYLENGNQNLPKVTYKVQNISIYKPEHVLSNAFVVRGENSLVPVKVEKYSPDEIIISGSFSKGDTAILKTAFYPGWKINNADAINLINMPATRIQEDTERIVFRYDPVDAKIGMLLSIVGILSLIGLIIKRKEFEKFLNNSDTGISDIKARKGRKANR
jgi:hypothetical protein